jgi:hypothetical protein
MDRSNNCAGDTELDQSAHNPATKNFRRERLHGVCDEVVTDIDKREQNPQARAWPRATCWNKFRAKERKKKSHQNVPKNEPRKMAAKLCFGAPKHGDFAVRPMHELCIPDESKYKHETKCCNECDEEFFPVHNFFRLRLLLSPSSPKPSLQNASSVSIPKMTKHKCRISKEARMLKTMKRSASSFEVRHCIRLNV